MRVSSEVGPILRFRSSFLHAFAWNCTFCSVASAVVYLATLAGGNPIELPPTLLTAGGLAVFLAVMTVVFPVRVLPTGVSTYDAFGKYDFAAWEEIAGVRLTNVLGLRYVTFLAPSGRRLYIPTWLSDFEGLLLAVRERAGEGHALVCELRKHSLVRTAAAIGSRLGDDSTRTLS